jgi:hypothetical protein
VAEDPDLDVDVIAAMLRADGAEAADLLDLLGTKLEGAVPGCIQVKRRGGLFGRKRQVEEITATFTDARYVVTRDASGPIAARGKIVRGVQIATREISMSDCIAELSRELQRIAETNADARRALQRLVLGQ